MAYLAVLGFLEVLRPNKWLIFHMGIIIVPLYIFLMSIRAIDPVCLSSILSMRVTLFHSGMLCVTNIQLRSCNDTLFCSELNGEHADQSFMSLRCVGFEIY